MKQILLVLILAITTSLLSAQNFNSFYGNTVANTSQTNLINDLTTFENFGVKEVGSAALTSAENWITARYNDLGYTDVTLQPFSYSAGTSNNIIVTKTGSVYPNTFLIIDAHYDTINGTGTNDNGSGTVLLLELARLLKDVDTEYSIKFIHFSGEEDGLIGSNYYVNNTVVPENLDLRLVFNIDEVGGVSDMTNDTIICERDLSNPSSNNAASNSFTNSLATCMQLYSSLETEISNAYASDYVPFENNGYIITGLFEQNESPYAHTTNDTLEHMDTDYFFEVTKGALGAAMEFAVAYETLSTDAQKQLESAVSISPNPAESYINVIFDAPLNSSYAFKLVDLLGKTVLETTLEHQEQNIRVDNLSSAQYLAVFSRGNQRFFKTIIVK
ncbi:M28 family peptidase [Sediminibacter sp. Hel_I_10]|uniref:M28 family peptidase n=1 Tax=Sediminibacter sp. Hel_I_10 TaxID=1392490 RepID=UPI00047A9139|nr:M28 family peptidase [Sediminibacter sp. Hel_I_10]